MTNRVLTYTIGISLLAHLLILAVIGGTSAAKPIDLDNLKLVKVDVVKTPDDVSVSKPDQPKPEQKSEAEPEAYVPPVKQMQTAAAPSRKAVQNIAQQVKQEKTARAQAVANANTGRPGNPGGAINMGSTSANGQNLGGNGTSGTGYVPNNNGGYGNGSGTEAGTGTHEPAAGQNGNGGSTAVAPPAPPAPPQPRTVSIDVCAISHMKPGKYCQKTIAQDFQEGNEPGTCSVCKEPEPVHVNRTADREEPELVRSCKDKIRIPDSVMDEGIDATVTIGYTVDVDGSVTDVKVTHSSGNRDLDRAVVEAAKRDQKYRPAVQDGVPRAVKMTWSVKFKV
jgi:TonB family protein